MAERRELDGQLLTSCSVASSVDGKSFAHYGESWEGPLAVLSTLSKGGLNEKSAVWGVRSLSALKGTGGLYV